MTSKDSQDETHGPGRTTQLSSVTAQCSEWAEPDPVHPMRSGDLRTVQGQREHSGKHALSQGVQRADTAAYDARSGPPLASALGVPAILLHQVVALEVGSCACPVGIHRWAGDGVGTILLTPTQAQVWARAGRLTLVSAEGDEYRLTVLAPQEAATAVLGAHWPLREPAGRIRRVAAAAAHDVGDVLTFPAWLTRTTHLSGDRNRQLARLVNRIRRASPATVVFHGQTFGHVHAEPTRPHPYDHKGLVGHEGWPHEL